MKNLTINETTLSEFYPKLLPYYCPKTKIFTFNQDIIDDDEYMKMISEIIHYHHYLFISAIDEKAVKLVPYHSER